MPGRLYVNGDTLPRRHYSDLSLGGEEPTEAALRLACGFQAPATVQPVDDKSIFYRMEAMKSAPRSPNGQPMEAVWERPPEAPDGEFSDARPYFVSLWGGIVIRGKRNGDRIDRMLSS